MVVLSNRVRLGSAYVAEIRLADGGVRYQSIPEGVYKNLSGDPALSNLKARVINAGILGAGETCTMAFGVPVYDTTDGRLHFGDVVEEHNEVRVVADKPEGGDDAEYDYMIRLPAGTDLSRFNAVFETFDGVSYRIRNGEITRL